MVQYRDFIGGVSVDFEEGFPSNERIQQFTNTTLHKDDCIIQIDIYFGEYHHAHGQDPHSLILTLKTIDRADIGKPLDDVQIKEVKTSIDHKDFFRLFKRLSLSLNIRKK